MPSDTEGIFDWPGEDYFITILRAYLQRDRATVGRVGHAYSELIDAADLLDYGISWMRVHFHSRCSIRLVGTTQQTSSTASA